jgi:hypothetical protein
MNTGVFHVQQVRQPQFSPRILAVADLIEDGIQ